MSDHDRKISQNRQRSDDQPISYDRQRFGKAVRKFRGEKRAGEFAHEVGLSPAVLSRIERGRIVERRAVEKVATVMGVSLDRFPAGAAGDPDRSGDPDRQKP